MNMALLTQAGDGTVPLNTTKINAFPSSLGTGSAKSRLREALIKYLATRAPASKPTTGSAFKPKTALPFSNFKPLPSEVKVLGTSQFQLTDVCIVAQRLHKWLIQRKTLQLTHSVVPLSTRVIEVRLNQ